MDELEKNEQECDDMCVQGFMLIIHIIYTSVTSVLMTAEGHIQLCWAEVLTSLKVGTWLKKDRNKVWEIRV
ncbi:hypothetical protein GCM10008932_21060 [Alkalibacterium iburiense]|uniref:Uncharacterized protein n=1 Tax=Alkalibacterium iburiense TaxID=290589 RepID=A0ABN0XP00_9LACT